MGHTAPQPNVRFLVYENLKYIGESAFYKDNILIGKSREADLVLNHQSVADVHALIQLQQGQAFIINKNIGNGLRLNGLSIKESEILTEDVIQLGPFSIIFRHDGNEAVVDEVSNIPSVMESARQNKAETPAQNETAAQADTTEGYSIVLVNQYPSVMSRTRATENLSRLLHTEYAKVDRVLRKKRHQLKKGLDLETAQRLEKSLKGAGVLCIMESADGKVLSDTAGPAATAAPVPPERTLSRWASANPDASRDDFANIINAGPDTGAGSTEERGYTDTETDVDLPETAQFSFSGPLLMDEDEEDEDLYDAPFSLKSQLTGAIPPQSRAQRFPVQIHVSKTLGDTVVDSCFLRRGQRYYTSTESGRFCLAEYSSREEAYAYIGTGLNGFLTTDKNRRTELGAYRSEEYLQHRRKQIYRVPLSQSDTAVLYDGQCQYTICLVESVPSPEVQVILPEKTMDWRHWAYSAGTHFFLLLCISIYMFFHGVDSSKQKPHFVKIDLATLKALETKKEVPPPPKIEPPPKPEPVRVAEKVKPPEKKPPEKIAQQPVKTAQKSKPQKQVASARQVSRHPNAGGGFGEGNIADRNVNQAGILSILGKNAVPGPSAAIASVTNIDAVKVPGATGKNFTVGGIKGSVGTGKITMGASGGGIVTTKGSTQVLRSAGAGGPGTVAALEKGSIGQSQVKGMVTAKMTRTVKVEGGMSREMVKQVIDQHMGEITYCYESALVGNPTISGRAIFEWKILLDGSVGEIRIVASTINSHQVHDCIKSAIRSWTFPRPVGSEVVVSYPFVFDLVAF